MTAQELLLGLQIGIAIVVLIILYHTLFIVVSLRKSTTRIESFSKNIEKTILEPVKLATQGYHFLQAFLRKDDDSTEK